MTSLECLRSQLKYSINRRLLLIRDMYPGVKLTNYQLRKVYRQRGVKQRSLVQSILLTQTQIDNRRAKQLLVFPRILTLAADR